VIGPESMRAVWCNGGVRGSIILGFEWVCTSGGPNPPISHHLAHFMEIQRKPGDTHPISYVVRLEDDFGPDPMMQVQVASVDAKGQLAATLYRLEDPPKLMSPLLTIPVVYDTQMTSCKVTIRRGPTYIHNHMCWVESMRRLGDDEEPLGPPEKAILRESYQPMKET
jgi:hypothetical protein